MLKTRELDLPDFEQFLALAGIMHQECEPEFKFDPKLVVTYMFQCINHPTRDRFNIWVVYRNKVLIGMALATADNGFYSPELRSEMHYWYVLPEYRGTRAAAELLRAYERWSREIGAVRMRLGAEYVDVKQADVINNMIAKRGFTRAGEQFYKALQ